LLFSRSTQHYSQLCCSAFPEAGKVALVIPSEYTKSIPTSVVLFAFTAGRIPMRSTIGTEADRKSTACPPYLGSGARSRIVIVEDGRNLLSQNAKHGPAMPDPTTRTLSCVGWLVIAAITCRREKDKVD
jgi:hypothetical protein